MDMTKITKRYNDLVESLDKEAGWKTNSKL